jgi:hypothetical protein
MFQQVQPEQLQQPYLAPPRDFLQAQPPQVYSQTYPQAQLQDQVDHMDEDSDVEIN